MNNEVWQFVFGAIVGIVVAAFIGILVLNETKVQLALLQDGAIERGHGKYCIGEVFVWNDQSCELNGIK